MRKILFLVFNLLLINLKAQPVLTAANTNPVIGDNFGWFNGNNQTSPGNPGANQTWNYSAMTSSGPSTDVVILHTSAMHYVDFPLADLSIYKGNSYYDFYNTSADSLTYLGGGSFSWERILTNPEIYFTFPFTYNSTYSDSFTGSMNNSGTTSIITGLVTVIADGYGSLELPYGTFTNILRVKRTENILYMTNGSPSNVIQTTYLWCMPGLHQPLLSLTRSGTTGTYNTLFLSQQTAGINENTSFGNIKYFPNPFSVSLNIQLSEYLNNGDISIYDCHGKKVKEIQNISGNSFNIQRGNFPAGIYYLQISMDGNILSTDKIIMTEIFF